MLKVFRLVGGPASAVAVTLPADQKIKVGYAAVVLTKDRLSVTQTSRDSTISGPAELVLSGEQSPTIIEVSEQWKVDPRRLVAWTAQSKESSKAVTTMSGPGEMVLSAQDGIFRVDVGPGSRFVVDPLRVVAHTGLGGRTVYRESRLDTLAAWTSWVFEGLKRTAHWSSKGFDSLYRGAFAVAHFLQKLGPQQKALPPPSTKLLPEPVSSESSNALSSEPSKSVSAKPVSVKTLESQVPEVIDIAKPSNAHKFLDTLKRWQAVGADKTFYYTHPPKLEFQGPCSVLIS